uniref:SLED domain-containing protein n=1 Tax=Clastoptera arizonana TaxID=38151 RepID=A0A1B6DV22_9HEMI
MVRPKEECTSKTVESDDFREENAEEENFDWAEYLKITESEAVTDTLFSHVEDSLKNGLEKGMFLEVPTHEGQYYWIASIVLSCGTLLRLAYLGDKNKSNEFWCDLEKDMAHPLGWCEENKNTLCPPAHIKNQIDYEVVKAAFKTGKRAPGQYLTKDGPFAANRIKPGMKLEIQDKSDPYRMWVATIIENVGGRLKLCYDTPGDTNTQDFWLFYSSPRVFPMGWTQEKGAPWVLRKPSNIVSKHSAQEWDAVLESSKEEIPNLVFPKDIINKSRSNVRPHDVNVGMKLEAVHPGTMKGIFPASVTRVFDSYYFLVEIDSLEVGENPKFTWLASITHPYIFPIGWAESNKIKLNPPLGWSEQGFDWVKYLEMTKCTAAPLPDKIKFSEELGFLPNMKLEAVNPEDPSQICVATIKKVTHDLIWLSLESKDRIQDDVIFHINSYEIFPMSWCDVNLYPLQAPKFMSRKTEAVNNEDKKASSMIESTKSSHCCPKIYFNHKCFSGPFLSKGKLAQLPKSVGPGPVLLVLKEVLTLVISVAYISSRVLKELQITEPVKPGNCLEILKAKYKTNLYQAGVEIVTSADKVEEYCKEICRKLQVCPYMFGPKKVEEKCPDNCHTLSKTRFLSTSTASNQSNLVGRRKAGRPSDASRQVAQNSLFSWPRRPEPIEKEFLTRGVRKQKKKGDDDDDDEGKTLKKKMRYATRGVKLPNFGVPKNSNNSIANNIKQQMKKASSASETSSVSSLKINSLINKSKVTLKKKRGRKTKTEIERLKKVNEIMNEATMDDNMYSIRGNPSEWSINDLHKYVKNTKDCAHLADILKEEEFNGESFMLLNFPCIIQSLHLNIPTAIALCKHIEAVKFHFYRYYVLSNKKSRR